MLPGSQFIVELSTQLVPWDPLLLPTGCISVEREREGFRSNLLRRWNLHWVHWVGPLLGAACAALSCHVLLYPVDEDDEVEEKERKGGSGSEGRGQRNAVYRAGGMDSEEAPLCVSLSTSQLLQKSGSTRPLNRSMSGGVEWRGEGEGSRERREAEGGREEREALRREVGGRVEKEERETEGVDKHSGSSSGYMSGPPGRPR